jgi:hypothetical protein
LEDTFLHPTLEAVVGGGTGAETRGVQGLPLAAGTQDEQDGFHADAVGGGRLAAAEGMRVSPLGDELGDGQPEVIGYAPLVHHQSPFHHRDSNIRSAVENQVQLHQEVVGV